MINKSKKLPYRLALKLGQGNLAWSVVKIKKNNPEQEFGDELVKIPEETKIRVIRVVTYDNPNDMLVPMSALLFEQRLQELLQKLPPNSKLERCPFNRSSYRTWLGTSKDTHQKRSEWANLQELI